MLATLTICILVLQEIVKCPYTAVVNTLPDNANERRLPRESEIDSTCVMLMAALLPGWLIYVCIYNCIMWCHKVTRYMNVVSI